MAEESQINRKASPPGRLLLCLHVQISVYRTVDMCHFLAPAQESNQRKRLKGARPSSRSTRVPLKNPPAPSPVVQYKTAGRRERSRRQQQDRDDMPSRRENDIQSFRCAQERYIGEGAFVVREHGISASPMAASFGTFLAETRKVRSIHRIDISQFEAPFHFPA